MFKYRLFLGLISFALLLSCSTEKSGELTVDYKTFSGRIDKLKNKRIYFGHQSVGKNIMHGLDDLLKEQDIRTLNVIELPDTVNHSELPQSYFAHSRIGENTAPNTKCDAFSQIISGIGTDLDIALLKFCYVDITESSDISVIFDYYQSTVDSIKTKYPDLTLVHVTAPLLANSGGWKLKIKRLINYQDYTDPANIKRNKFNTLLKNHYEGEPVFDLAEVESTYPGGKRESFTHNGQTYYSLIHDYTYDGGHLNETGRKRVAAALVKTLADTMQ